MTEMKSNHLAVKAEILLTQHINNSAVESNVVLAVDAQENGLNDTVCESSFVIRTPRADSKLILQNMEEVLNSVKKKHRAKHKRKRELKKQLAQMEATTTKTTTTTAATGNERTNETGSTTHHKEKRHERKLHKKKPLQVTQDNQDLTLNSSSILHHFMRTPRKDEKTEEIPVVDLNELGAQCDDGAMLEIVKNEEKLTKFVEESPLSKTQHGQPNHKTNAFEVMMNARNKSIGSNACATETMPVRDDEEAAASAANSPMLVKRKLLLQSLAERKGAGKRKLDEEARAAYIEQTLEQRAKRLKNMLERTADSCNSAEEVLPKTDKKTKVARKSYKKKTFQGMSTKRNLRSQSPMDVLNLSSVDLQVEKSQNCLNSQEISTNVQEIKRIDNSVVVVAESPTFLENDNNTKRRSSTRHSRRISQKQNIDNEPKTQEILAEQKANTMANDKKPQDEEEKKEEEEKVIETSGRPRRSCMNKKRIDYKIDEISPVKKLSQQQQQQQRRSVKQNKRTTSTPTISAISTPLSHKKLAKTKRQKQQIINDYDDDDNDDDEEDDENDNANNEDKSFDEIITLDESITPKKLAPLFTRQVPKPVEDPQTLQARREFLRSGVPEKVRLEQNRIKQYEQNYEESWQLYPSISHVRQYNNNDIKNDNENKIIMKNIKKLIAFKDDEHHNIDIDIIEILKNNNKQRLGLITNCRSEHFNNNNNNRNNRIKQNKTMKSLLNKCRENVPLALLPAKRLVVKSWKLQYDRFPTYKCYNQLREKYRYFSALDTALDTQQVNDAFMVTRVAANITTLRNNSSSNNKNFDYDENSQQPPATAPNGELLFTEKYKPLLFEQVLVNLTPVVQLREFLSNWCTTHVRPTDANNDFINNDDSWSHNSSIMAGNSNTVVLLGPRASGKTNAVFALANELNFNVLEINAGMKRTGKRLVQELHEATQSHQIVKETTLRKQSQQQQQQNLMQISLNNERRTRARQTASSLSLTTAATTSSTTTTTTTDIIGQRKCLILIEDADIAFEQTDAGFIDAIYTLAAASKRPVIIVASNPNCAHLQRLMQQQTITFNLPHVLSIARYLAILSLIENCPISIDDIVSLYLYNGMDVRRTLLEMQLFVQSGGDIQRPLAASGSAAFVASPTKAMQLQQHHMLERANDEHATTTTTTTATKANEQHSTGTSNVYIHQNLFNFYTLNQNTIYRIPYPVDFTLLHNNLSELLQKSTLMSASCKQPADTNVRTKKSTATCSPKKAWINTVSCTAKQTQQQQTQQKTCEDEWRATQRALCDFYEHISVAALLDAHDMHARLTENHEHNSSDLSPRIAADLTHTLVEQAIKVDLCAEPAAYNLFHTPKLHHTLCNHLNVGNLRGSRAASLDWEPALRNICRLEQQRASEERKSTRFYHYLRNSCSNGVKNFSTDHFVNVCSIMQTHKED